MLFKLYLPQKKNKRSPTKNLFKWIRFDFDFYFYYEWLFIDAIIEWSWYFFFNSFVNL
jgi:hypothetical protein